MPRRNIAALAAAAFFAVVLVLYVIHVRTVHASEPASLAALMMDPQPTAMPQVAFADPGGGHHTLAAYKGRYVLLNLWATWCAPCVQELPALARLQAAVPGMTVVTVNAGRGNAADTQAFLKAHGAAGLPAFMDSNSALIRAFGAAGLPLSILIDPQGREIARASGPANWDDSSAIAYFKSLTAS
jgi:thiol-disulfide isomerase/thioredoxin